MLGKTMKEVDRCFAPRSKGSALCAFARKLCKPLDYQAFRASKASRDWVIILNPARIQPKSVRFPAPLAMRKTSLLFKNRLNFCRLLFICVLLEILKAGAAHLISACPDQRQGAGWTRPLWRPAKPQTAGCFKKQLFSHAIQYILVVGVERSAPWMNPRLRLG